MRFGPGRLVVLCGLVPTIIAALLSLFRPSFLSNWEYGTYDAILRATPTRPPGGRIAIVDIDDRSLTTVGQWPWRRDVIGQLISRLRDLGASIVALDIMFAEPDRFEGIRNHARREAGRDACRWPRRARLRHDVRRRERHRQSMPAASARTCGDAPRRFERRAVLPCDRRRLQPSGPDQSRQRVGIPERCAGSRRASPTHSGAHRDATAACIRASRVTSVMSVTGTRDATLRVDQRQLVGVVARQAKRAARRQEQSAAALSRPQTNVSLRLGGRRAPRPARRRTLSRTRSSWSERPPWGHAKSCRRRSTRCLPASRFRPPSPTTSFSRTSSGVRRTRSRSRRSSSSGFGLVSALLVRRFGLASGAAGVAACLALVWFGPIRLMSTSGVFLSPLFPTMGLTSALAAMTVARFTSERQRADQAGEERATSQRLMVQSLLSLTEVRDAETGKHSRRTQAYTRVLAKQLSTHPQFRDYLTPERIELLRQPGAAARHRQGRRARSHPSQARRAHARRVRGDAQASRATAATSSFTPRITPEFMTT